MRRNLGLCTHMKAKRGSGCGMGSVNLGILRWSTSFHPRVPGTVDKLDGFKIGTQSMDLEAPRFSGGGCSFSHGDPWSGLGNKPLYGRRHAWGPTIGQ